MARMWPEGRHGNLLYPVIDSGHLSGPDYVPKVVEQIYPHHLDTILRVTALPRETANGTASQGTDVEEPPQREHLPRTVGASLWFLPEWPPHGQVHTWGEGRVRTTQKNEKGDEHKVRRNPKWA